MDLTRVIAPVSVEELLADLAEQRFRHIRGEPHRFDGLLPWATVNRVLAQHRMEPPRLRLVKEGVQVPQERYYRPPPSPGRRGEVLVREVLAEVRGGATLVLDGVDEVHEPLTRFAASLERSLGVASQINAYVSFGTSHGFPVHWDGHHVLVLQLEGRKAWSIFGATRDHPMDRDVVKPKPPETPTWEGVLERGDVLYVPRGTWHRATALAEPSLHLSMSLLLPTGIDLLGWVVDELRADERLRRDLPLTGGDEARRSLAARLREAVLARLDDRVVDTYFASRDAQAMPRRQASLPWIATGGPLPDDATVQLTVSRRLRLQGGDDGPVSLDALGQRFRFAGATRPLFDLLLDGHPHAVEALVAAAPGISPKQVRRFLDEILEKGLIGVLEPSSRSDP